MFNLPLFVLALLMVDSPKESFITIENPKYKTIEVVKTEVVLDRIERKEIMLVDEIVYLHSVYKMSGQEHGKFRKIIPLIFPEFENTKYIKQHIHCWGYAAASIPPRTDRIINPPYIPKADSLLESYHLTDSISSLSAYALDINQKIPPLPVTEKPFVHYVMDAFNGELFNLRGYAKYIDEKMGTSGYNRFDDTVPWEGVYYLGLKNIHESFNLNIKVSAVAIVETQYFKDTTYTEKQFIPIEE